MAYKQKENTGALFKNKDKQSSKHPDYKGTINVNGTEYWISGWKKETDKGTFLSLSVQPKEKKRQESRNEYKSSRYNEDFD